MPYSFPTGYSESACVIVPIPVVLVPFVAGALRQLEAREAWNTESDYQQAYNAFAELEALMLNSCLEELIESNRQIYRLIDSIFNGRGYTVADTDPLTIYPEIPAVPQVPKDDVGLLLRTKDVRNLLDNAINGTRYPDYDSGTSMRVELVRIRELLEQNQGGELDDEMLAELVKISALLA